MAEGSRPEPRSPAERLTQERGLLPEGERSFIGQINNLPRKHTIPLMG